MKYLTLIFSLLTSMLIAQTTDFNETISEIKTKLSEKNITIFAEIDHSSEAEKVGLTLPKTKVFIVGNPKIGTLLMQENPEFALHLPLKILITETEKGIIVDYQEITPLAKKYKLKKSLPIAKKIDEAMKKIIYNNE